MSRKPKPQPTVFRRYRNVDFNMFDRTFRTHLRALVTFVTHKGGLPPTSVHTYKGVDLGEWYFTIRQQPHNLTLSERTALRAIPGVILNMSPRSSNKTLDTDPDRDYIWKRLQLWAQRPLSDPITKERFNTVVAGHFAVIKRKHDLTQTPKTSIRANAEHKARNAKDGDNTSSPLLQGDV